MLTWTKDWTKDRRGHHVAEAGEYVLDVWRTHPGVWEWTVVLANKSLRSGERVDMVHAQAAAITALVELAAAKEVM